MRYKLYAHPCDDSDDPVIADDDLLPRIEADSDNAAIALARERVEDHTDHKRIGSWELTELDAQDVNIRDVYSESVYHGECGNCEDGGEATRFCDGCDFNVCEACHILHNEDLDGEEPQGFVVINTANGAVIERDNDPSDQAGLFVSIQVARGVAAAARAESDNSEIFVYRVTGMGDTSEDI